MKLRKKTKEELEREVAEEFIKAQEEISFDELNEIISKRKSQEIGVMNDFGRILWPGDIDDEGDMFIRFRGERIKLTWAVIFAEIGKLKAIKDFRDFEWRLSDIKDRLDNMTKEEGK